MPRRVSVFRNILYPLSFEWQINSKHILPYWNSTIVPNLFYSLSPFGIMIFRTLEKYFYGVVIYYQHFAKSRKRPRNLLQCFSPPGAACFIRNTSIKVLCTEEENENLNNTKTLAADLCTNFRQIDKSNHQNRVRPFNPRKKTDQLDTLLSRSSDKSIWSSLQDSESILVTKT